MKVRVCLTVETLDGRTGSAITDEHIGKCVDLSQAEIFALAVNNAKRAFRQCLEEGDSMQSIRIHFVNHEGKPVAVAEDAPFDV